ncbi:DUF4255 domain-containing protein [Streptomyces sp. NPDC093085]|uniref:DUF4255 domain-containing protein n=1 Tax=Streptomyces sp. NPDC093085 TaxID=3155068 RepID=UPI0034346D2F
MIHEIDDVLKRLLTGGALSGSGVEVAFDAPTSDWAARQNAPTLDAYLYDISEDTRMRQGGAIAVRDERGVVVKQHDPPRWFRLAYLVTAWTKRPQDEHRLLSAALATLLPREMVRPAELPPALAELGLSVQLSVSGLNNEARSRADIWTALGGELKPSIDLVVTAPFPVLPEWDFGPPVLEVGVRVLGGEATPDESGTRFQMPRHLMNENPWKMTGFRRPKGLLAEQAGKPEKGEGQGEKKGQEGAER